MNDGYRGALLAGAARTAAAVGVALDVVGQTVVDYMRQVVDIQTAGCHVGGHKQLGEVLAELLHSEVALLLREVAVERLGVVAVLYQFVGYLLGLYLGAAEDDGEDARIVVDNAFQRQVFVLGVHHVVDMVHILGSLIAAAHHNLLVVVQVVARYGLYLLAHGGREEQRVAVFGHTGQYLVDALRESHVEHAVGFVEHHIVHSVEMGHATVHQVYQAARGGHDNLHALVQGVDLVHYRGAAVDGHDAHALHVAGKVFQVVGYLQAQLARGTQDDGLRHLAVHVYLLQEGDAEGGGLARACLRQGYHVVAFAKQIGYYLFLNGHGMLESHFRDGAAYLLYHAQFFKCLQVGDVYLLMYNEDCLQVPVLLASSGQASMGKPNAGFSLLCGNNVHCFHFAAAKVLKISRIAKEKPAFRHKNGANKS